MVRYTRDDVASPNGLFSALQSLFPDFGDEELVADIQSGDAKLHTIMREFSCSFAVDAATPSQLTGLATLMAQSVAVTDDLENAVGTCFLEHLRHTDRRNIFWKYLPRKVKDYIQTL